MSLMLITPANEEPVSLEDLKIQARISHSGEDQLLEQLLRAARAHLEWVTGWSLAEQVWQQDINTSPLGESILLRKPFIFFKAATLLRPGEDDIEIDLTALKLTTKGTLKTKLIPDLTQESCLRVQYCAGLGAADLPSDLRQALLVLTSYFYENRESLRAPAEAVRAAGVLALIAPYREVLL